MTQDQTHTDGSRIDSTTRRGALAALGGAGLLAALGGSVQADVGGGPESDELAHLLSRFYEGPEDELPEPGVEGRRFLVTDDGGEYEQWSLLRDQGDAWAKVDLNVGSVGAESLAINGTREDRPLEEFERLIDPTPPIDIDVPNTRVVHIEYTLFESGDGGPFTLRLNNDDDGNGLYDYRLLDGSFTSGADHIDIFGDENTFQEGGGFITIYETSNRNSFAHSGGLGNDVTRPFAAGQRDTDETVNSIQLDYGGTTDARFVFYEGEL